jgi:carboxypeptidase Q
MSPASRGPDPLKKIIALLVCLVGLTACGQSDQIEMVSEDIQALQTQALQSDLAYSLLHALTTEVGPRMAGSDGDRRAVQWARSIMESLGFDKVWVEPVTFPVWRRGEASASLITSYSLPMAVTALGGSPGTEGLLRGAIVEFDNLQALEEAQAELILGKIVFINERMQQSQLGGNYSKVVKGRTKGPYVAAEKGALALVIRSVGTDDNRLAHTGTIELPKGRIAVPSAAISNPDADLLESVLRSGKPVELELNLDCGLDGAATSFNVIGEVSGSDPDAGFFAMGAHLDSWDLGTGAVDDGSGVVIVMAAAKLIADLPRRSHRGIRVILFANEEQNVYGGREYARAHAHELGLHFAGAESDFGAGRVLELVASVSDEARPSMEKLAAQLEPLGISYDASKSAYGGADLGQMRKLGMPAIDLRQDGSEYFDIHHTANDTLDKVDPDALKQNVAAWVTLAWFMAESQQAPGPLKLAN